MTTHTEELILGQKYAYATAALIAGIACFTNILGLEKAVLAIIFARLALKSSPPPVLRDRRGWAITGMSLGIGVLVLLPTILLLNFDRIRIMIDALIKVTNGK